jgi:aspartate aminotransferase
MQIANRILEMQESATILMATKARELKSKGFDIIDLSLGEPDFDTPTHIKEAAKKALDAGFTKYTPVAGNLDLREAIARKFKRDNNLDFTSAQIAVSNGAKQCIANACLSVLNPGDEAIILSPYWVSYYEIIRLAEATPVLVHGGIDQDFKVTAQQIEAAITPKTKLLIFSSPCNPSGAVFSLSELESIAKVLESHPDIYVVSDEIYEYINFTGKHASIGSIPSMKNRTITVNGFAKGFAMTGWRLGYMGGPKEVIDACNKMQGQFTSGANSFSQKAAVIALDSDMSPTYEMAKVFETRRNLVLQELSKIEGMVCNHPEGAFYIFPNISHFFGKQFEGQVIKNSNDYCMYLLNVAHVSVVTGEAFGDPNCFRFSYATSDAILIEACRRIKEASDNLV